MASLQGHGPPSLPWTAWVSQPETTAALDANDLSSKCQLISLSLVLSLKGLRHQLHKPRKMLPHSSALPVPSAQATGGGMFPCQRQVTGRSGH